MCKTSVIGNACVAFGFLLASCSSDGGVSAPQYDATGPAAVGVLTTSATDSIRGRTLPIEVWYPIEASGSASGVIDFETDPDHRAALSGLLDAAPTACVAKTTAASRNAAATAGEYPLVLYSHCYTCTRWSAHAVMERLASHGFIVVAPDHIGDTLFDRLDESPAPLNNELVDVREADIRFLLDRVWGATSCPMAFPPTRPGWGCCAAHTLQSTVTCATCNS